MSGGAVVGVPFVVWLCCPGKGAVVYGDVTERVPPQFDKSLVRSVSCRACGKEITEADYIAAVRARYADAARTDVEE